MFSYWNSITTVLIYVCTYIEVIIMTVTEAQYRAQKKYDAAHTKQFQMKLSIIHDADILEWLDQQESKQGSIKSLIRKDIEKEKKGHK